VLGETELPERVRALRGMGAVLPVLEGAPRCYLVGGAVRDLLLARAPVDVDITVEGDAAAVADRVAEALGGEVIVHERFGTATVTAGGVDAVNLARTRREAYPVPGALPEVEPAGLGEDLARRDFTINAIALALNGDRIGGLVDPHDGRGDLAAGLVRVLHERSFVDDPTRLLRAVRYAARLGFALEPTTESRLREAVASGTPAMVSGPRIRDELLDLLAEPEAPRAVGLLAELGIDRALHRDLSADSELVASAQLGAADTGADPVLVALAAMSVGRVGHGPDVAEPAAAAAVGPGASRGGAALAAWIDRLGLPAGARDDVVRAARRAPELTVELRRGLRPSQLRGLLDGEPAEALALALALGAPAEPVLEYVSRLRGTRLEITGADLIAAGLPESPALGRALDETLARKLDGEVGGREEQLRVALSVARGEA